MPDHGLKSIIRQGQAPVPQCRRNGQGALGEGFFPGKFGEAAPGEFHCRLLVDGQQKQTESVAVKRVKYVVVLEAEKAGRSSIPARCSSVRSSGAIAPRIISRQRPEQAVKGEMLLNEKYIDRFRWVAYNQNISKKTDLR